MSAEGIARAVGAQLRRERTRRGWTRGDLLDHLDSDLHVQTIAGYEQGIRHCTVARLVEICGALDIDAAGLLAKALTEVGVATLPRPLTHGTVVRRGDTLVVTARVVIPVAELGE